MSNLMSKLKKASSIKDTNVLTDSIFFGQSELTRTNVPIINVAFSGRLDGGFGSGLTVIAGPSKHFKTNIGLVCLEAYMRKHEDAVCLFYDSEFGTPPDYLKSFNIDTDRILHLPIAHIEELKFDISKKLDEINRGDHVIIFIDSVGNLASKKEVEDARNENSAADMTRAKAMKSLFRIVTPELTKKDIPCITINHTYKEQSLFPKDIVSGGCLEEGTQIIMADDSLRDIDKVQVGELVKTLDGPKEVTATWNPDTLAEGEPDCYSIEFEDGHNIVCSDKHMFLVNDSWERADELSVGDDCVVY